MADGRIRVFLADDNLLVREGVRTLLGMAADLEVVGVAADYDGLVDGADAAEPHVVVTDIRMPPAFGDEGITAAKELRKRHPGTGVVILSQYDDPEYVTSLLRDGASTDGFAYLLKDRVAEADQLVRAVREVAAGGNVLDPKITAALVQPVQDHGLTAPEEQVLRLVAEGRHVKAIAAALRTTPEAASGAVDALFLKLAREASTGATSALRRLRMLHEAIVEQQEQGETLSRLLPTGLADKLRAEGRRAGETERLEVTVLMSDIRGYSGIAEHADPSALARQLNEHRAEMNRAVLDNGGTVMQFVGDAVMAVFGAPLPVNDHAGRSLAAAVAMHERQTKVNAGWAAVGLPAFPLGIGLSTGEVAAALLGSDERLEYTVVGDTVNLAQRLQQWADGGEIVLSEGTYGRLAGRLDAEPLPPAVVKGREAPVIAYKITTTGGGE